LDAIPPLTSRAHYQQGLSFPAMRGMNLLIALLAAVATALVLGVVTHDNMGIPLNMIRADALSGAGFIFFVIACTSLVKRRR
jgi:hypothetical protein